MNLAHDAAGEVCGVDLESPEQLDADAHHSTGIALGRDLQPLGMRVNFRGLTLDLLPKLVVHVVERMASRSRLQAGVKHLALAEKNGILLKPRGLSQG